MIPTAKPMISMSGISGDCTIVFPTFETLDLAIRIVPISQFLAKLQVLPVYDGFMAAILNFLLISMSGISGDCSIVFATFEAIDLPVGNRVDISIFGKVIRTSGLWQFYGCHLEYLANIDVGH